MVLCLCGFLSQYFLSVLVVYLWYPTTYLSLYLQRFSVALKLFPTLPNFANPEGIYSKLYRLFTRPRVNLKLKHILNISFICNDAQLCQNDTEGSIRHFSETMQFFKSL